MPAEISTGDPFGRAIVQTIREHAYESVLEIGSMDGLGSTQVFIEALRHAGDPRLVCLETDPERFRHLAWVVREHAWVVPLRQPSISAASLTPRDFDRDVWESPHNHLRYPRDLVATWWDETLDQMRSGEAGFLETNFDTFDVILIDGGEFTGYDDYRLAKGRCRCLMLDDVHHAYKCARAHAELAADSAWRLHWQSPHVRNGASIWLRA